MKDCEKIHPLLPLYAESQLSGPDRARLAAHLKACARARKELEEFSRLARSLERLPEPEFPEGLHERIMARIAGREKPRSLFGRFWLPGSFGLAAAATVALLLFTQSPDLLKGPSNLAPSSAQEEPSTSRPPASRQKEAASPQNQSAEKNFEANADFAKEMPGAEKPGGKDLTAPAPQAGVFRLKKERKNPGAAVLGTSANSSPSMEKAAPPSQAPELAGPSLPRRVEGRGMMAPSVPRAFPPSNSIQAAGQPVPLSGQDLQQPSRLSWSGKNGSNHATRELLTDAGAFGKRWRTLLPGRPLPELDFTRRVVVLLEAGAEPNPGYSIHVTGLGEKDGRLEVHYRVEAPPAGALEPQVLSRPWCMRVIPRPEKPVVFVQDP